MSALDLVAVVCCVLALGATVVLTSAVGRTVRIARELEAAHADFVAQAVPAIEELRLAVAEAGRQVDRVDGLVDVAASIGGHLDAATEVTYRALTSPVIKTVALASGTRRAARRLRGAGTDDDRRVDLRGRD